MSSQMPESGPSVQERVQEMSKVKASGKFGLVVAFIVVASLGVLGGWFFKPPVIKEVIKDAETDEKPAYVEVISKIKKDLPRIEETVEGLKELVRTLEEEHEALENERAAHRQKIEMYDQWSAHFKCEKK